MSEAAPSGPRRVWFGLAIGLQLFILALVPSGRYMPLWFGTDVVLKTAPVDPYTLLSGYYVRLGYEIAQPQVPGLLDLGHNETVYAVLAPTPEGYWDVTALHPEKPDVPDGSVLLRGRVRGNEIRYGIESYFIPESQRQVIADDLTAHPEAARVDIRVDAWGRATLIRLRIEDRVYDY